MYNKSINVERNSVPQAEIWNIYMRTSENLNLAGTCQSKEEARKMKICQKEEIY